MTEFKTKSTSCSFDGDQFSHCIVAEDSRGNIWQFRFEYTPNQAALLNEQFASYVRLEMQKTAKPID